MARKNNASEKYPSFDFEPLPPEPAQQSEVEKNESGKVLEMPKRESASEKIPSLPHLPEADDECQYCGAPFESERSCRYCLSNHRKKAYLKKEKLALPKKISRVDLINAEIEFLRKSRPELAKNEDALATIARVEVSRRIDPSKFKPPEDPLYH